MATDARRLRVLHAPRDIGCNAYYLARGERAHGFDSQNLVFFKQWYGYPADIDLGMKVDGNPAYYLRWWLRMVRVAMTCDVLHFNFGGSFLSYYPRRWIYPDASLWRRLGIATFVTFQGCEGRVSQYVLENLETKFCTNCRSLYFCQGGYDDFKLESNSQAERRFDGVFALNPDILRSIRGARFLPYSNVDLDAWLPPPGFYPRRDGTVRILHAPTNREIKGTDSIIAAVEALKGEGQNVELIMAEKVPHEQVRKLYESADLLVDQLLIGWYGGLAVELMALGKPIVAYIRQEDLRFIPREMKEELPVVSADRTTLTEVLRGLVLDAERRWQIGLRSRAFVEKWHHPKVVGKITTDAYRQALAKRQEVVGGSNRLRVLLKIARPTLRHFAVLYRNNSFPELIVRGLSKLMGKN
jgi:glycosyltransferase involved in cell wall biosynthesis